MKNWKRTVLNLLLLCLFALAGASSIRGRRRPFRSIKAPAGQCAICRAVHIHIVRNVSALRANAAARTNVQSCYPTFVPSLTLQVHCKILSNVRLFYTVLRAINAAEACERGSFTFPRNIRRGLRACGCTAHSACVRW